MLLESKVAVIHGAGGAVGGAVASTFAREGAKVFLAGRTRAKLDKVAGEIRAAGGVAETARVDALDEQAVNTLGSVRVTFDAMESLRRQWACELGPHGVRTVTLKTGGVPKTIPDTFAGRDDIIAGIEQAALLDRTATLADVGNVAAFVASDQARTMTAATVNISCGALMDY
jgi:NAD(P)-dependent dehydrogenase (short-subunit alcohol dehydrogenase family)